MLKTFDEVFDDYTKYGTKIKTEQYETIGTNIIIDQGQSDIAGYTDQSDGLFTDVPVIVFGDHTRIIKYINRPFFLGADGTKILKSKIPDANYKYLYYALKNAKIPNTGYNRHFKWLKQISISYPEYQKQRIIVEILDKLEDNIGDYNTILRLLDELVKARFIELFGDPITNSRSLSTNSLKDTLILKAGDFTEASNIFEEYSDVHPYPCYGGNGVRGFVSDYNQDGEYSLIGRQGALSGNVQFVAGKFKNTEHALLVTPLIPMNSIWLNQLLINLDLKRYQTGAAQPGISVKNLQEIQIIMVPIAEQNKFADFVQQVDKSRFDIKKSITELEREVVYD